MNECSHNNLSGHCPNGMGCYGGSCVSVSSCYDICNAPCSCSPDNPDGSCDKFEYCNNGKCESCTLPDGGLCTCGTSSAYTDGTCPSGYSCIHGQCKKENVSGMSVFDEGIDPVQPAAVLIEDLLKPLGYKDDSTHYSCESGVCTEDPTSTLSLKQCKDKCNTRGVCDDSTGLNLVAESYCFNNQMEEDSTQFMTNFSANSPVAFNMAALGDFNGGFNPNEYVGVNYGNYNNQTELQVLFAKDDAEQKTVNPNICTTGFDPSNHCRATRGGAPCYTGLVPTNLTGWNETPTTTRFTPATSQKYYSIWACSEPAERSCPTGYRQGAKYINNPNGWKFGCMRSPPPEIPIDDQCDACDMSQSLYGPITGCNRNAVQYTNSNVENVYYGTIYYNYDKGGWQQCKNVNGCPDNTQWVKRSNDQIKWTPGVCLDSENPLC